MRNQILTLLFIVGMLFACATGQSQTALPYYTGFDNATEKAGWTEYQLGVTDGLYHWSYSMFSAFSDPECLRHGYPVGGTEQTDDWFVSPEFDFTAGAMIDSLRYSFSGFGTPGSGDTIGVYLLNGSPDPSVAAITILYSFTDSMYINDDVWRKTVPIEIPATSGQSYIAFRYTTVVNWLDAKFDNLSISGETVGTNSPVLSDDVVVVYPNPSQDIISIKMVDNLSVTSLQLVDLQGRTVMTFAPEQSILDINGLISGPYILQITTDSGSMKKKIVVQ